MRESESIVYLMMCLLMTRETGDVAAFSTFHKALFSLLKCLLTYSTMKTFNMVGDTILECDGAILLMETLFTSWTGDTAVKQVNRRKINGKSYLY